MRVKELANKLDITPETVRYYTRIGYLNPPNERGNNYRDYGPNEERYLRFILNARRLGFSVKDIGELLCHADKGRSPCPAARSLIIERLKETEQRFATDIFPEPQSSV
jgi:DNA-binding transcriptional MerR regulator